MIKKILRIKIENIVLIMLLIPLTIIQFEKANIDSKTLSIVICTLLYGTFYYCLAFIRSELIRNIKDNNAIDVLINKIILSISKQKRIITNIRQSQTANIKRGI